MAERDGGACARCGKAAPASRRQIHHRRPRGMGGRKYRSADGRFLPGAKGSRPKGADCDFMENLVLLCGSMATDPESCHYQVEKHRTLALHEGWLCHEWEEPREKQILARDGQWHLLVEDTWDPMLLPTMIPNSRSPLWSFGDRRNARRSDWKAESYKASDVRAWVRGFGYEVLGANVSTILANAYQAGDEDAVHAYYARRNASEGR